MTFFVYTRKSVFTGKGESIGNQVEMCREYILNRFPGSTEDDISFYEDEGFSGKNVDRPDFQRMLRDIKTKKPNFVVCYRLDRISRNVSDFSTLIESLNNKSISFICIKEEFDTSKPMGKAMMYIASVFAQLERETIAERIRDNMLMLARTGRWLGGTTPTGYTSEKVQEIILDGKVKTACKLKEKEEELTIVATIFEKYLEIRSVSGVSKYLIQQNLHSRKGNYFSLLGIKEILQNPVYCTADKDALEYFQRQGADVCFEVEECSLEVGLLSYNKRDYTKRGAPRHSMEKWIIAIGKHPGLIPGKKWAAVQAILEENKPDKDRPAKQHNDYSLLSGLIYCGKCGKKMFAKARIHQETFDYACSSKLRGGVALCDCQNINGQQADDKICEFLLDYTREDSSIYALLEELKTSIQKEDTSNPLEAIEEQIKKKESEMKNLIHTLSQGNLAPAFIRYVNATVDSLDKELRRLQQEKKQWQKDQSLATDTAMQAEVLAGVLSSFKKYAEQLTIHEKRVLIRIIVQKIVWDGANFHIFM